MARSTYHDDGYRSNTHRAGSTSSTRQSRTAYSDRQPVRSTASHRETERYRQRDPYSAEYRSAGSGYARRSPAPRSAPASTRSRNAGGGAGGYAPRSGGSGRNGKNRKRRRGGGGKIVAALVLILLVGLIGIGIASGIRENKEKKIQEQLALEQQQRQELLARDTFYDGITVEGVSLSGMTREQALRALDSFAAVDTGKTIELTDGEQSVSLQIVEGNDIEAILDEAYAIGRTGTEQERLDAIEQLKVSPVTYSVKQGYSVLDLDQQIESARELFDTEAKDAKVTGFSASSKKFTVENEVNGRAINVEAVKLEVDKALNSGSFDAPVQLVFDAVEPKLKSSDIGEAQLLGKFTTTTTSNKNRNTNISLCSEALNGKIVMPGREFSVNETTGKRSAKKGYLEAKVIRNGVYVDEPGGGVCQVSSTLFNAVVRAGFKITERHNHTIKSSYVPESEDAAIDYPDKDFRFENNSPGPVAIVISFNQEEKQLTARIYGTPVLAEGETLDLESKLINEVPKPEEPVYQEDPTLPFGQEVLVSEGRGGAKYETYLIRYKNGKEVSRELLYKSSYPAKATVYAINSKAKPPEEVIIPSEDPGASIPPEAFDPEPPPEEPIVVPEE